MKFNTVCREFRTGKRTTKLRTVT